MHFGSLIGTINKNSQFIYHFDSLDLIINITPQRIFVDEKGEQTTLYGRNLTKKMIENIISPIRADQKIIINNKHNDILGLGKFLMNQSKFEKAGKNQVVIKNLMDKGWYLRKGG